MPDSLSRKIQAGLIWNSVSVFLTYLVGLVRSVVLARILTPDDFGLFGMALTVIGGLTALTATRLDLSVISTKFRDDQELSVHLNTMWTIELLRRLFLSVLLLGAAYPMSLFYNESRLYTVLIVVSLIPLIQGFENIGLLIFRKEIRFQKIVLIELSARILSTTASILIAVWTNNAWALVSGPVILAVSGTVLSYFIHPFRPRLMINKKAGKRFFSFSKYAILFSALQYVMEMADNILIGRLFGTIILGSYVIAYDLATLPIHALLMVVGNVMLPVYTEISGAKVEQERLFLRIWICFSTLLTILSAVLMLLGEEIVVLLYGEQWLPAGPVLRILAMMVFFRGHIQLISPLITSVLGIASEAKIKIVEIGFFLVLLYPFTNRYGMIGAAYIASAAYLITLINRVRVAKRILPNASKPILHTLLIAAGAIITSVVVGAYTISPIENRIGRLTIGITVVVLMVLTIISIFSQPFRQEFSQIYITLKNKKLLKEHSPG